MTKIAIRDCSHLLFLGTGSDTKAIYFADSAMIVHVVPESAEASLSYARRYIQCMATRDIFRRPHEETSALSGTTCIIIAESAKQIHSVCLSVRTCPRKAKYSDRDLGHAPALPGMPSRIESSEQRKASGTL